MRLSIIASNVLDKASDILLTHWLPYFPSEKKDRHCCFCANQKHCHSLMIQLSWNIKKRGKRVRSKSIRIVGFA